MFVCMQALVSVCCCVCVYVCACCVCSNVLVNLKVLVSFCLTSLHLYNYKPPPKDTSATYKVSNKINTLESGCTCNALPMAVFRVRRLEDQLARAHVELENLDKQQLVSFFKGKT